MLATNAQAGPASSAQSNKRKMDAREQKFYAVRAGFNPGVYNSWTHCKQQITGFKGAVFKSFLNYKDAETFASGRDPPSGASAGKPKAPRFYGVAVGRKPGVYTDWSQAEASIVGSKKPKYKKFATREEAEAFVRSYNGGGQPATTAVAEVDGEQVDASEEPLETIVVDARRGEVEFEAEADESEEPPAKRMRMPEMFEEQSISAPPPAPPNNRPNDTARTQPRPNAAASKAIPTKPVKKRSDLAVVYTDGSSLGNGRAGAVGGVGVYFGKNDPRNISERLAGEIQTNQRAELTAILRALETIDISQDLEIRTDSKYSIQCVTEWYINWERNGWKTRGGLVKNQDLIRAIRAKLAERDRHGGRTQFVWVKGHDVDIGNINADLLAVEGAKGPYAY